MNLPRSRNAMILLAAITCLLPLASARAWHEDGHNLAARAALAVLPPRVPDFFRQGGDTIAHLSIDPDVFKVPSAPQLTAAEQPEHFLDLELLQGKALPATRQGYVSMCMGLRVNASRAGFLPYAITEWTQRLMLAMAEHRRWPDDPVIRTKCLVYAGLLAHYAADTCQPLHTTVHYDGRIPPGGRSPRSGIHEKMDALPARLGLDVPTLAQGLEPRVIDPLLEGVSRQIQRSFEHVERVYELEGLLPASADAPAAAPEVQALGLEHMRAASEFLASLYLTAWDQSAKVTLQPWLDRPRLAASTTRPATRPATVPAGE